MRAVTIGSTAVGGGPLFLIAGPCVLETLDHALFLGEAIKRAADARGMPYVFKASFDKANRTSIASFRGPRLEAGLRILAGVKSRLGVSVLTDIHEPAQAAPVADVVDALQIPAFLCRQTDLVVAAAETGKAVNLKKGQFLAPWDMGNVIEKAVSTGNRAILVTERGTSFGYNNLVVDFRSFPVLRQYGYPVVFDVTHSLQRPGGGGAVTSGDAQYIDDLASAGVAAGVDGIFLEVHDNPSAAKSDAQNAYELAKLPALLERLVRIDEAVKVRV